MTTPTPLQLLTATCACFLATSTLMGSPPSAQTYDIPLRVGEDHDDIETRRRARHDLERHLGYQPDDHSARRAYIRLLMKQRFVESAIKEIDAELQGASRDVDLWLMRAACYRHLAMKRGESPYVAETLRCYGRVAHLEPNPPSADMMIAANLAFVFGDYDGMMMFAAHVPSSSSEFFTASMLAACGRYMTGDHTEAARIIDSLRRNVAGEFAAVMHGYELAGVPATASLISRGQSELVGRMGLAAPGLVPGHIDPVTAGPIGEELHRFWKSQDPTPTTPLNERYLEHCYRVAYADARFSRDVTPGRQTDQGRMYIRFGEPTLEIIDGAVFRTKFIPRGSYWDPWSYLVYPGIDWVYQIDDQHISFRFEDLTLQGDFQLSLRSLIRRLDLIHSLPTIYIRTVPGGPLEMAGARTRFRGLREDVMIALGSAIPAVELDPDETRTDWSEVEVRWEVFDPDYQSVARSAMVLDQPEHVHRDTAGRSFLLARADFDLAPGDYVLATEVRDHRTGREGVVKRAAHVEPVKRMMSEIELCHGVRHVPPASDAPFVRYDAQVVPNPLHVLETGDPLRFYYEVYQLGRDTDGHRRLRIKHRVRDVHEKRRWRQSYPLAFTIDIDEAAPRYQSIMPRVGQIDVSSLEPGKYELEVVIEDLVHDRSFGRALEFVRQ